MPIPEQQVRNLIKAWKEIRGDTLSYSKAEKRLKQAVEDGCPLLDDCTQCEKRCECPISDPEKGG